MREGKKYITEYLKYLEGVKTDDILYFEMPSFWGGEYAARVYSDEYGLYILKKNDYFNSYRGDITINKPMWSETVDLTEID